MKHKYAIDSWAIPAPLTKEALAMLKRQDEKRAEKERRREAAAYKARRAGEPVKDENE